MGRVGCFVWVSGEKGEAEWGREQCKTQEKGAFGTVVFRPERDVWDGMVTLLQNPCEEIQR